VIIFRFSGIRNANVRKLITSDY